jgi:hypothetical protein
MGLVLLPTTYPRLRPFGNLRASCGLYSVAPSRLEIAGNFCLPFAGLVLISPDNDIRNVVITLPSSYYRHGVRGFHGLGPPHVRTRGWDPGKVLSRELFPEACSQDVRNGA